MKVQNIGRVMIARSVELERDIKPGEVTVVVPGFEQSERVLAMLQTGSLAVVAEGVKTEGGATVVVHPDSIRSFDSWGHDLPLPKLAAEIQALENRDLNLEQSEATDEVVEHTGEASIITSPLLSDEQKTNVLYSPPAEPKPEAIDELMVFLQKKGSARRRFVEQMTDLRALRAALAANSRSGATRDALKVRIEQLSHVPDKFDL